jgi:hypothetical protein
VIDAWEGLSVGDIEEIRRHLRHAIAADYSVFTRQLEGALSQSVNSIRILPLYGSEVVLTSTAEAIGALQGFVERASPEVPFARYEIQVRFTNGDTVDGTFHRKEQAVSFLDRFA